MATPYITAYTVGAQNVRSDFDGNLGFKFTVGGSNIVVSELGRWKIAGNSQTHTVYILDSGGSVVVSASVDLSAGSAGDFVFTTIADTALTASADYYCMSAEANGGDTWYDPNTTGHPYTTVDTGSAAFAGGIYQSGGLGNALSASGWDGEPYVPVNFKIGAGSGATGQPTSKRFGGVPFMGTGGFKGNFGGSMWRAAAVPA